MWALMRVRLISVVMALLAFGAVGAAQDRVPKPPKPPDLISVPAGEFQMGSDRGASWERPAHRVRTPAFEIAARPVTNAEFALFRPGHSGAGDRTPDAPVTGVNWQDANAYCQWLSERTGMALCLPYEAWWERAVRGGLNGAKYPWGEQPLQEDEEIPANDLGVYGVGYNLWEWMSDWYSPSYFAVSPVLDPRGPERGVYRVLRGGGYRNDRSSATVYNRGSARPDTSSASITFRVARALDEEAPPPAVSKAAPPPAPKKPAASPRQAPRPPTAATSPPAAPRQQRPRAAAAAAASARSTAASIEPLAPTSLAVGPVSFEASGGDLVVKLGTASKALYKTMVLSGPDRVVVDIPNGDLMGNRKGGQIRVGRNGVNRIRYSQFQLAPPAVRVVIDLDEPLESSFEATASEIRVRLAR